MEDDEGEYEELEDDFLFLANDGKPALIKDSEINDEEEDEYDNKDVVFVEGNLLDEEVEERLAGMREAMA